MSHSNFLVITQEVSNLAWNMTNSVTVKVEGSAARHAQLFLGICSRAWNLNSGEVKSITFFAQIWQMGDEVVTLE